MVSADNDDSTAANVWRAYAETGLRRDRSLIWNAVPWYLGGADKISSARPSDIRAGGPWLLAFLGLLPRLRGDHRPRPGGATGPRRAAARIRPWALAVLSRSPPEPTGLQPSRSRSARLVHAAFGRRRRAGQFGTRPSSEPLSSSRTSSMVASAAGRIRSESSNSLSGTAVPDDRTRSSSECSASARRSAFAVGDGRFHRVVE